MYKDYYGEKYISEKFRIIDADNYQDRFNQALGFIENYNALKSSTNFL